MARSGTPPIPVAAKVFSRCRTPAATVCSAAPASRSSCSAGCRPRRLWATRAGITARTREDDRESWAGPRSGVLLFRLLAWQIDHSLAREIDRVWISRVSMPHHPGAWVGREDALELFSAQRRPISDHDHAGVYGVADADAAAVVHGHPGRARGGVDERVEDRPVGDGVAAVAHPFGLTERRRDRARIEMVASDHDRRGELPPADELVDARAEFGALAVAEPADACRQSLERHTLAGEADPSRKRFVVREE